MSSRIIWFSLGICWSSIIFRPAHSIEGIIRDQSMDMWFSKTVELDGLGLSWVKKGGNNVNTCGTGENADFWCITKGINLNTKFSEVIIHVDVEAELTFCFDPGTNKHLPCFSNNFEVHIHPENYGTDTGKKISVDKLVYSPLYNITNNTLPNANLMKSTHTFSFNLIRNPETVTLAVRSRGACGTIYRMKMYYYYCEETFINGIKFENTSSPARGFNKSVTGNCSANAVPPKNATYGYCHDNGTWSLPAGDNLNCLCVEGYGLSNKNGPCLFCSTKSYKKVISNDECAKCPENAISYKNRTGCVCEEDYYRLSRDNSPCYALPKLKPETLRIVNTVNSVNISWTKPDNSTNETTFYDVKCWICTQPNTSCNASCSDTVKYNPSRSNFTTTWVVVSNLEYGGSYIFRIYAKNSLNGVDEENWNYTETGRVNVPTYRPTPASKSNPSEGDDSSLYIILGAVCVLVVILIIFILICLVRRKIGRNKSTNAYRNRGVELPDAGRKLYVDPSNYDDPEAALVEFTNELDSKSVFLERLIGGGEFGDVYKGELTKGKKKIPIAAKTLKHDADAKSERDFTLEASVMGQFDNPNIVRLEGVITKSTPRMIVLEYMSNGSLDNYLKSNDNMLTNLQLIGMARGVSAGMQYLAEINFIHRDLAARNILVNDDLLCKIADFGLSRELGKTETSRSEYSAHGGKIPVRWTAPEAINFRTFSTASDVWSYGIVLWEIMSYAERPYWQWDNFKVLEELDSGYRLPSPLNCPKGVYELMLHCWKADRCERPSFAQITIVVDQWIRSPETLDEEITSLATIGEWLASLKMSSYETKFVKAGYKRKSQIIDLTDEDLKNIGVTLVGHRNKIKKGIDSLSLIKNRESLKV